MTLKIGEIYNNLLDFESKAKKKDGEKTLYPIHKKLQFSSEKYNDISDWIIDNLQINEGDFILDAGCGVGYVLTKICSALNCNGLGISLSEKEIKYASENCIKTGLNEKISFEQMSFNKKFSRQFDVIIAVESIKHSISIQNTIENLVEHLKPGGRIFILDDYETNNRYQFLKSQVKKYWAVASFYSFKTVAEKLSELNLPFEVIDFTSNVEYTTKNFTGIKIEFGYLFLTISRFFPFYKIYNIFFAGLCLERLYKMKALEYKAIIATKINRK